MKTLTMTPSPNKIIAALLDIAQAAYVLIHSPGKGLADNLKEQMERLETLPQYCDNPVNGPCRASKYLESFLVGEHIVGTLERTEGVDMLTIDLDKMRTGTTLSEADIETIKRGAEQMRTQPLALVPGDAIGFEVTQEWNAPAKLRIEPAGDKADMLTNMLADTADEAHKIMNDAELLRNLYELCNGAKVSIWKAPETNLDRPWRLSVWRAEDDFTLCTSTSFHQAIVEAHKLDRDLCEDEGCPQSHIKHVCVNDLPPKPAPTWDMSMSMPLSIMPVAAVVGISTAPAEPTVTNSPRRQEMNKLLIDVKDGFGAESAKSIFGCTPARFLKMCDIPDDQIETVIAACEHKLKEPK